MLFQMCLTRINNQPNIKLLQIKFFCHESSVYKHKKRLIVIQIRTLSCVFVWYSIFPVNS